MNSQETQDTLQKLYYDPRAGLFNATKLYQKVKELGIKLNQVKSFIEKQNSGQLHRPPLHKEFYPITAPPGSYQADLIFYPKTKKINNGFDTILTIIEITSRMGYCFPMKGKKTAQVIAAMKAFLNTEGVQVNNLTTDKGSEFISATWKKLMAENGIKHYLADEADHNKMGLIERFNRTAKLLISKYQTMYKTTKWIDALDDLVHNYNHTVHSTIGLAPANVTLQDRVSIRMKAAVETQRLDKKKNLNVGDTVRVLERKELFGKEGPSWSKEIHKIVEDNTKSFKLEGLHRRFKHYELLKVDVPPEENPFPRKVKSFDVQEHLAKARAVPRASGPLEEPNVVMTRRQTKKAKEAQQLTSKTYAIRTPASARVVPPPPPTIKPYGIRTPVGSRVIPPPPMSK
jgi:hypothetical protein